MMAYRFEEARALWEAAFDANPRFAHLPLWTAFAYTCLGRDEPALEWARRAEALDPDSLSLDILNILEWLYAHLGQESDAQRIVATLDRRAKGAGTAYFRWLARLALGEVDRAHEHFVLSFEERHPLRVILKLHPIFAEARGEPRFAELIDRIEITVSPPARMKTVPAGWRVGLPLP
jgi:tetratricopeptide (TPR) repeat protein